VRARRGWTSALLVAGAAALGARAPQAARVRHADIVDEPDSSLFHQPPTLDAGEIPELDSGLGSDAFPACADRPGSNCFGTVDFPCGFETWVASTASRCQKETGCKTNGWLDVTLDTSGCVTAIAMDQPNDDVVACLLAELGTSSCTCDESFVSYFFGSSNMGPCADAGAADGG
jgi:hypothetical protein